MTKWSRLPNAKHIDAVLASMKANPGAWSVAWSVAWQVARGVALNETQHTAWAAARNAAWWLASFSAAQSAAWQGAWDAVPDSVSDGAGSAAWDAIAALIAYDHASKYLEMTSNELRVWVALNKDPTAFLLIPTVIAFEKLATGTQSTCVIPLKNVY